MISLDTYIENYVSEAVSTKKKNYLNLELDSSLERLIADLKGSKFKHIDPEPGYLMVGMTMIGKGRDAIQEFKDRGLEPGAYWFADLGMNCLHMIVVSSNFRTGYRITLRFDGDSLSSIEIFEIPSCKKTTYRGPVALQNAIEKTLDILEHA